jgi:hypothetical protein
MLYMFGRPTNSRDNASKYKQQEMLAIVLRCANFAPIPGTAKIQSIKTEGNLFTRSFRLTFEVDTVSINDWLHSSKGIRSARLTKKGGIRQYILNTKCGYEYGEIQVDSHNHKIMVYVSKS